MNSNELSNERSNELSIRKAELKSSIYSNVSDIDEQSGYISMIDQWIPKDDLKKYYLYEFQNKFYICKKDETLDLQCQEYDYETYLDSDFSLNVVPEQFRTYDLCLKKLKLSDKLKYVPEHLKTKEVCEMAFVENISNIKYIPDHFKTKEMCLKINKKQELYLYEFVPEHFKTLEIYQHALQCLEVHDNTTYLDLVKKNSHYIYIVPFGEVTIEIINSLNNCICGIRGKIKNKYAYLYS